MKAVLFSGAEIFDYTDARLCSETADLIVCADSGIRHADALGLAADIWVGDFDSAEGDHAYNELIKLPVEKDDTDTMAAARILVERGVSSVILFGCIGTRLDHTYANLFVLKFLLDNNIDAQIVDEHNVVKLFSVGEHTVEAKKDCYMSILPYGGDAFISKLVGVKYQIEDKLLESNFPIGVSNEIIGNSCELTVRSGVVAVLLSHD